MTTDVENNFAPLRQSGPRRNPRLTDRLALWLLKLAKMRRGGLDSVESGDYEKFYEQFFEEKDLDAYDRDRRMVLRRETINRTLAEQLPQGGRILDAGCGLGDVLAGLDPKYDLLGFDFAEFNTRVSARRLKGRAGIWRGSIYELPVETGTFDACLCLEVLEHIQEDARAARELARSLKPGGFLIAAVPYTYYWPEYLKLMGHFRHYTRESFSQLMEQAGLKVEAHLPNYPNFHQSYTRRYAMVRAQSATIGRIIGGRDLYSFRWPWRSEPALDRLAKKMEPLRIKDSGLDYSRQESSTFLLARKP